MTASSMTEFPLSGPLKKPILLQLLFEVLRTGIAKPGVLLHALCWLRLEKDQNLPSFSDWAAIDKNCGIG
jgi:hypothetical protein